ncbi:MAG: hypothetical protein ACLFN5_01650 [bacterium]
MSTPVLIQHRKSAQGELLQQIIRKYTRRDVFLVSESAELYEVTGHQNYFAVYFEPDFDFEKQLNWLKKYPGLTVAVVNRKVESEQLKSLIDAGIDDYIYKPYQPERICRQLKNREKFK